MIERGQFSDSNFQKIEEIRNGRLSDFLKQLQSMGSDQTVRYETKHLCSSGNIVEIGRSEELTGNESLRLLKFLKSLSPWKKGPFKLFGHEIDAEWRSDLKWQRLLPYLNLKEKTVADIGCHNGYFMYRMLPHEPRVVVGFEPIFKHWQVFQFLQSLHNTPRLLFEPLGVEHIHLFSKIFDTIFCMGILYHHTDPVGLLRKMHMALAKGGEVFIDCQGIPGEQCLSLTPEKRYAGAKGIWFLPTLSCLKAWLQRTQFRDIDVVYAKPLSPAEQRSTDWADIKSLEDFLDKDDRSKTIEGYPAPMRFYLRARKG